MKLERFARLIRHFQHQRAKVRHAIGGMAAFIPSRRDAAVNETAMAKVRDDKERESSDGFDGTWVAHPGLVEIAKSEFDAVMKEANQIARKRRRLQQPMGHVDDLQVHAGHAGDYFGDLTEVTMAAAGALRPGGALIFTVERAEPEDAPSGYRINPHGRYSHTFNYLLQVLDEAGLADPAIREVTLRKEAEKWVDGWLVSARIPDYARTRPHHRD